METTRCAQIIWTVTKDFSTETGDSQQLVLARKLLAKAVFATDGRGFPEPVAADSSARETVAWKGCVDAALAAEAAAAQAAGPKYLLLWPEDKNHRPVETDPVLGLKWPRKTSKTPPPVEQAGPVLDGQKRKVCLFAYDTIDKEVALRDDGDADLGLFPRLPDTRGLSDAVSDTSKRQVGRVPGAWAWVLFVVAILLGAFTILWVYSAAELVHSAASGLLKDVSIAPPDPSAGSLWKLSQGNKPVAELLPEVHGKDTGTGGNNSVPRCLSQLRARMNGQQGALGGQPCRDALQAAWQAEREKIATRNDRWAEWLTWLWKASDMRGQLSLLTPLAMSAGAIILLILSSGVALKGVVLGALIDERNRISLSRLQQLCWTIVLFGGFTVLGIFNIALVAGFVRDLGQIQALEEVSSAVQATREFVGFFPSMDPSLWAVLGVTVAVSPYLSKRILSGKELPTVKVRNIAPEALNRRGVPSEALWVDLFTGEGNANAGHVDVSRLQHLVITFLLLAGYIVLLVEYARTVDATAILMALVTGAPVFAAMPPVDPTFVGLLVLSHAGYLAFKALPSAPPTS